MKRAIIKRSSNGAFVIRAVVNARNGVVDVTPPDRRGRVVGVFMAFILVGQAGGAAGFGHLAHAVGYGPMFAILSAVLIGACVLAFRLER